MVERVRPEVWDVLEEVIREHPVLLNRAPTLHRLGIQAFEPVLVEGRAIKIHPMVCTAYNADFDGDQMAVHVPLSAEAQAEARLLMLSANNLLSPAHGNPVATPTQDMVLGCYYLTIEKEGAKGEGKYFRDLDEVKMAYDSKDIELHSLIFVRMPEDKLILGTENVPGRKILTTLGRLIFNEIFPNDFPYINSAVGELDENLTKGDVLIGPAVSFEEFIETSKANGRKERKAAGKSFLSKLIAEIRRRYGNSKTAEVLDSIKGLGYKYATRSGTTIGIEDVAIPPAKAQILKEAEDKVQQIESQYKRGLLLNEEKYNLVINVWTETRDKVQRAMMDNLSRFNPVYMMATSGARGNVQQLNQLAGMRGLVADPSGRTIDVPIKANFREGLTVLEYFISTHGTRKGLADTALRTADSGYLTRRLVDVAQDVIVREEDCGTTEGIETAAIMDGGGEIESLRDRIVGRTSLEDIKDPITGEVKIQAGSTITEDDAKLVDTMGIKSVKIRSVLKCKTKHGVCVKCYGRNMATGNLVEVGEAVGTIAAQSIGEPGTQLTMRTFHTGGVAGDDITRGLPRVEELFEARKPKGLAVMAEADGVVSFMDSKGMRKIILKTPTGEEFSYSVSYGARLEVKDGQEVKAGDQLTEGSLNPHDILRVKGPVAAQQYVIKEVQDVYRSQGVEISDKHVEVVVRQMLRKVKVEDPGDTDFLPGGVVDIFELEDANDMVRENGGVVADYKPVLLGITKASLATDSFLSAASFQETTRVLTDASIKGKLDPLIGLKENVIIGKLIPAGTGMARYRNIKVYDPNQESADETSEGDSAELVEDVEMFESNEEIDLLDIEDNE